MSGSDTLPSIEEIERVWFELLREIRETGVVTTFTQKLRLPLVSVPSAKCCVSAPSTSSTQMATTSA